MNAKDQNLIQYAYEGNLPEVHKLLGTGANVNAQRNTDGATSLWVASAMGHVEVVRALIQRNNPVDLNLHQYNGATALWIASHNAHVEVVRALLQDDRVDVNLHAIDGVTALDVAFNKGHFDVVSLFMAHTAGVVVVEETQLEEADVPHRSTYTAQPHDRNERTPRTINANERTAAPPHRVGEVLLDEEVRENVEVHVTDNDVLGGRGGRVYRHPGNIRYLGIVAEYAIRYRECGGDNLQNIISETIVNNIFEQGGRFLRWEAGAQSWRVMTLHETHVKVKAALRDAS